MSTRVGRPISVGDVLSKSTSLLMRTPALLIPQVVVLAISLLEDVANANTISGLGLALLLISLIVSIIVAGAYPSMVQAALSNGQISVAHSFRQAAGRFLTLLITGILVGLIVFVGFILLIVPGIVFITWYAYTVPAIMLENKGTLAGMSASKAFGRDKKWSTFSLVVVAAVVLIVVAVIEAVVSLGSPLLGRVVDSFLSVPVGAWISVMLTYTYITYGPSSVPAQPDTAAYGVIPPAPGTQVPQPGVPASASPSSNFCRFCGSPIHPDSKFCSNCGQAL